MSELLELPLTTLDGEPTTLGALTGGRPALVVNVASKCGLTPQYEGLQELYDDYAGDGLTILGFPCDQFGHQEPGSEEEIGAFCQRNYGVTFPMFAKIEVNGPGRHPVYTELTALADAEGEAGDVQWNFEKFLVGPDGKAVARFRPMTDPEAPEVISAIETSLPA